MRILFAHGGETHDTGAESAWHTVVSEWYIGLPIYLMVLFVITAVAYLLSRKSKATAYNALLITLFIAGISLYSTSPPISIFSLALGFGMALFQVMIGLNGPGQRKK